MTRHTLPVVLALAATFAATSSVDAARRVVVVKTRPPKVRIEVRTTAPSANHVWVSGHWSWNGSSYVWSGGSWTLRPTPRATWVPGHWTSRRAGWVWVPGHWAGRVWVPAHWA